MSADGTNKVRATPAWPPSAQTCRTRRATCIMAAQASADQVGGDLREKGMLFPSQSDVLEMEVTTAVRVVEFMFDQDRATIKRPKDLRALVEGQLYKPQY